MNCKARCAPACRAYAGDVFVPAPYCRVRKRGWPLITGISSEST